VTAARPAWPRPEFLAGPSRRPALAWLWTGAALVVCALAASDWLAARDELASQRERLARALRHSNPATPRPPAAAASNPAEADAIRAARAVIERIAHPWDRILANVEAETPSGVQWLQLDHDADDPGLRLEGAAPDVADVMRFIDGLSDRPGWTDVVLGGLHVAEGPETAPTRARWRFELHAGIDAHRLALAGRAGER
jgi:hypothetical protein